MGGRQTEERKNSGRNQQHIWFGCNKNGTQGFVESFFHPVWLFNINVYLWPIHPSSQHTQLKKVGACYITLEHCSEPSVQKPPATCLKITIPAPINLVLKNSLRGSVGCGTYVQSAKDQFHLSQFELPEQVPELTDH